ncbi:hypothetical protein [Denitrobaculum tricleocarpae]|uniref:Uncharacterized protein n=1 Tax=Denitrobaculum tricleocarpae TaxID=2591009 RepID=A0A545TL98_9PROT|nr:hypothetical protein [Denitrobaculum tricleocarpae]TQV77941.1 hypothetical protein FKG95_20620 [Denitrobaculum tricleocarpae]
MTFTRTFAVVFAAAVFSAPVMVHPVLANGQLQTGTQTGPGEAPKNIRIQPDNRNQADAAGGCHDSVTQTSYSGPCVDNIKAGGCESDGENASVPGNCPNSSEP